MFLINGMQLFCNKSSDCWVYIWIIFNLDPKTGHYKKVSVLFGGIIPGPNKPKNLESFLFPGLQHLSTIQNEGLSIWDAFIGMLYTSSPFLMVASADGPVMAYINGLVGHQGRIGCQLYCPFQGRCKGSHYYPVCLKPCDYEPSTFPNVDPSAFANQTFHNYKENLILVTGSKSKTQYKALCLQTGIVKPGIFLGLQL